MQNDQGDRSWRAERNVFGVLFLVNEFLMLLFLVVGGVLSYFVGSAYGAIVGVPLFVALSILVYEIFTRISVRLVFKNGTTRRRNSEAP
jgi:pilus assembly protein TadC